MKHASRFAWLDSDPDSVIKARAHAAFLACEKAMAEGDAVQAKACREQFMAATSILVMRRRSRGARRRPEPQKTQLTQPTRGGTQKCQEQPKSPTGPSLFRTCNSGIQTHAKAT